MRREILAAFALLVSACQALLSLDRDDAVRDAQPDALTKVDAAVADGAPVVDGANIDAPIDAGRPCPTDAGRRAWDGGCYFVLASLLSRAAAVSACDVEGEGAKLATFTSFEEWDGVGVLSQSNFWVAAEFVGGQWIWPGAGPVTYWPPGPYFDGGPPPPGNECMWISQSGAWTPAPCTADSAGAFCERPL